MKTLKEIIKLQEQCEKLEKEYNEFCSYSHKPSKITISEDGIGIRDANANEVFILHESFKRLIRVVCEFYVWDSVCNEIDLITEGNRCYYNHIPDSLTEKGE